MAISTLTELNTAVANWLSRSDLTSRIPEFVTLAQARINRLVKAQAMETKSMTISINAEYVNVPTDFLEARDFHVQGSPRYSLQYMPGDAMTNLYANGSGKPRYFSLAGSQFRFGPVPDGTYTGTLIYYAKPATLATTTQETNSLFPANPDLYLYGSLIEAEAFIGDDPRIPVWKAAFDDAVNNINAQAARSRFGGNSMSVRVG